VDEYMLTTSDNPYSPVDQYTEWLAWDARAGYNTPGLLARVTFSSDDLSEADQAVAIDDAMNEIVSLHADGFYKKVRVPKAA
jgi:hypothetical protein